MISLSPDKASPSPVHESCLRKVDDVPRSLLRFLSESFERQEDLAASSFDREKYAVRRTFGYSSDLVDVTT